MKRPKDRGQLMYYWSPVSVEIQGRPDYPGLPKIMREVREWGRQMGKQLRQAMAETRVKEICHE